MKSNWNWTKEDRDHKDDGWLQNLPVALQCGVAHDGRYISMKCHLTMVMEETMQVLEASGGNLKFIQEFKDVAEEYPEGTAEAHKTLSEEEGLENRKVGTDIHGRTLSKCKREDEIS